MTGLASLKKWMKRRDRKRIKQQIKSYHCPFGERRRQTGEPESLKTKTTRERERKKKGSSQTFQHERP